MKSLSNAHILKLLGFSVSTFFPLLFFDHCISQNLGVRPKSTFLALLSLSLVGPSSNPLTCLILATPAVCTLRRHLLACGGTYLLTAISFAVIPISDAFSLFRWHRRKRREQNLDLDYPVLALTQLLFWCFVLRTDNVWGIVSRLFERKRTLIASSFLLALGSLQLVYYGFKSTIKA